MRRAWFLGAALVCALAACGDDAGDGNGDDAEDDDNSQEEEESDGGRDAGRDSGTDVGLDAGRDAGRDAGLDAGRDAGPPDAGRDAGADAGVLVDAGRDGSVDAGAPDVGPVTFAMVYDMILAPKCSSANCHGGDDPAGNLDFSSENDAYDDLVGEEADGPQCGNTDLERVVEDEPDNSLLVQKVERTPPCGMPMPPGAALSSNEVALIRAWIQQGAEED